MSVSSLTRMTTPLSSDQSSSTQGLLMPKLKYRFRVVFENLGVSTPRTELTKQVVSAGRPNPTFDEVTIDVYNSRIKLAGKPSWANIDVVIRDDASGAVAKLVGEQLQKQFDFMEQSSASSGIDYKFITRLEMLDGGNGAHEPRVLESWELYGCYLNSVNYGDVDYASSDPVTITLTLAFDNALQTPLGSGLGTDVGRTLGDVVTG
jgi:hypothetical protein